MVASFGKFEAVAYRRAPCPQAWGGCVATSTARCCVKSPYLAALLPCGGDDERGNGGWLPACDQRSPCHPEAMPHKIWMGRPKVSPAIAIEPCAHAPARSLICQTLQALEPAFSRGDDLAAVETVRQTAIADQCHRHTRGAPQLRGRLAVASASPSACSAARRRSLPGAPPRWITMIGDRILRRHGVHACRTAGPILGDERVPTFTPGATGLDIRDDICSRAER